jgi:hypothetical protein
MALFSSKTADPSKDQKAIEIAQNRVREAMARLHTASVAGNVAEAERCAKRALEALKNPKLPRDFMRDESTRVKHLELTANMKATDLALDRALAHALADRMQDRAKEIANARGTMRKSTSLGATREFVRRRAPRGPDGRQAARHHAQAAQHGQGRGRGTRQDALSAPPGRFSDRSRRAAAARPQPWRRSCCRHPPRPPAWRPSAPDAGRRAAHR